MCDFLVQTHLAAAFMNDPDLRFMSIITFVGIVGLAAGLVVLEAIRYYRSMADATRKHSVREKEKPRRAMVHRHNLY